jgi:hypothetical protein
MSMNRTASVRLLVVVVICSVVGCTKSNPLLGKWKVSAPTAGDVPCSPIGFEFTPTTATAVISAAWLSPEDFRKSNGADTRVTVSVVSYSHDDDNYSVTVKGGKVMKFHLESGGFAITPATPLLDKRPGADACFHFVPAK